MTTLKFYLEINVSSIKLILFNLIRLIIAHASSIFVLVSIISRYHSKLFVKLKKRQFKYEIVKNLLIVIRTSSNKLELQTRS